MPEDSELNDEDFDAQFEQNNPTEEPEPEPEEETAEEVAEEPEEDQEAEPDHTEDSNDQDEEEEDFDKPVSEGETVEVDIEDLGSKGDGIARKEGFVIFVPGGEVGETYDVEITSVGRKFAFGEIAE